MDVMSFYTMIYDKGGYAMVAIVILSLVTATLIIWKLIHFVRLGVWLSALARNTVQTRVETATQEAVNHLSRRDAEAEAELVALDCVAQVRRGLRALEVIAAIAPLLGLLGTVLGMIAAFQALQTSGNQADPGVLAGGIWEALLTTAAGMAVAIPASLALAGFDSVAERMTRDIEARATRILIASSRTEG
ncbi:MotA/TolQ/ExbB proton channel family protein [Celeribacter sp.]|uniref:MotA/TolQ/ExbB proton channel family protein n=1 Tax=Celeribacter sp. TaxID=1890673 RepID=UPI003A933E32